MGRFGGGGILAAVCAALLAAGFGPRGDGQDVECLKAECEIVPLRLSRGQPGKIVIHLAVREGVEISPHPDFIIEFSPGPELIFSKNFFTARDLEMEVAEVPGGEVLKLGRSVEIPFTVSGEAKRGTHRLQGRIKYFARSRSENWCVKETIRFAAGYYTRASTYHKPGS
jgi:hypothetical protein